jgi:AraC family transcriptional regulator, regulatory protein of adaptative response / methylated-DNA-[protein]-cysteine methyltransferase
MPDEELMYQALLHKDSSFEGIFFVGVRTTSIFCRPTCRARKPMRHNVEFFSSTRDALLAGYRPCRICLPMEPPERTPDNIRELLADIQSDSDSRWRDSELRERGIQPDYLRRWFKKNHGMTFHAYLRALRIGRAFERIKEGEKVLDVALSEGYESLSGFNEAFRKNLGNSPTMCRKGGIISISRIATPLGTMIAGAVDEGICLLEFADRRMVETQVSRLERLLGARAMPGAHAHFSLLEHELQQYFEGRLREFSVPIVFCGTPFQRKVWEILREIPYGSTRSYKAQAALLGNPAAIRAVARANGDNRVAIIVPCHRVIGEQGDLVGYGGGIWRKEFLLRLEGARS